MCASWYTWRCRNMQTRKVILYTVNHVYFIIFNIDLILNIIKSLSNTSGSTTPSVRTTTTPGRFRRFYSSLHDYYFKIPFIILAYFQSKIFPYFCYSLSRGRRQVLISCTVLLRSRLYKRAMSGNTR